MKQFIALMLMISLLVGGVSAEQTAPPPDQDKIIEELDEHWTEEIFPDVIQDIKQKFEALDLGVPTK